MAFYAGARLGTLKNSGTILGNFGIFTSGVKDVKDIEKLENSGTISGTTDGITVGKGLGILTNSGTIKGGDPAASRGGNGINVDKAIRDLTNRAGGTIAGGRSGIAASAIGLLDNSGTIMGGRGSAVLVNKSAGATGLLGRLVNRAGGRITSKSADGVDAEAITFLKNSGTISGARDKSGLYVRGTIGTLINQQNGTISGGLHGIRAAFIERLSNHGMIRGDSGAAIALSATGQTGTLANSGTIAGATAGVDYGANTLNLAENNGRIRGGTGAALKTGHILRLNNSNTGMIASRAGNGIEAADIDRLDNTGMIRGGDNGISARSRITNLNNRGTIRGSTGAGLSLGSGGRLLNSGLITGGARAHGIRARGAIDLLQNQGSGIIEGQTGVEINPTQAGATTIDNAGILRDNFSLEGNLLWDGRGDTLQYLSARPALLTFTDNDAPAGNEPTRFAVDAGGRPFLRGTRRSARFGQAETIISIFDPTLYTLSDAALSQWTGAIFQGLDRLPGPGTERPGPNRRHKTGPLNHVLWARPFGGLHRFKQDGPFVPPARHRFAGGLAGFSALGRRAGGGLFVGAAQSVIQVSGPARDEDSENIFTGVWAGARINEFDLDAAVLVGRGRYRSEWQRANNRAPGGGQTRLRINERGLHIGLARASLGFPVFPFRIPANPHGGQFDGEVRLGVEGRMRLSGDTVRVTLGGQNAQFKASGGKAVTGFAGASFDYTVPTLNLTFSADVEARYGSMADAGIHGQLGFMWEF